MTLAAAIHLTEALGSQGVHFLAGVGASSRHAAGPQANRRTATKQSSVSRTSTDVTSNPCEWITNRLRPLLCWHLLPGRTGRRFDGHKWCGRQEKSLVFDGLKAKCVCHTRMERAERKRTAEKEKNSTQGKATKIDQRDGRDLQKKIAGGWARSEVSRLQSALAPADSAINSGRARVGSRLVVGFVIVVVVGLVLAVRR